VTTNPIAGDDRAAFLKAVGSASNDDEVMDLCRRHVLHGTPHVFRGNEDGYYRFRKRIAEKFSISFHEVYITGSAKLGYSMFEEKAFDLDSDIDVALVAPTLYDRVMSEIYSYQMSLRESRRTVTERELEMYHQFLEYTAIGWIRPDKLPYSFNVGNLKTDWFDFFRSISSGRSEAGDYSVNAGIFRS
jgi:predicted nucleotidyltransferase